MSHNKVFRPDTKQTGALVKAGKAAAIDARRDSKAQGIAVTFIEGDAIYKEHPNGKIEKVGKVRVTANEPTITKGTVLRRAW